MTNPEGSDNVVTQAPKWMGAACILAGLVIGSLATFYVLSDAVASGEPSRIEKAQIDKIVADKMEGYATEAETLRIIRAEVEAEKRARIEWETKLRNWCEQYACRCRRPGNIGSPIGAAAPLETLPPPAEK